MGSLYYQHKKILDEYVTDYTWIVVEQENYASYGLKNLEDGHLRFISCNDANLENLLSQLSINIIFVRSSLQYIRTYTDVSTLINRLNPRMIVVDRTPIGSKERFCIQKVPPVIYDGEMPVHIFTDAIILTLFPKYRLVEKFLSTYSLGEFIVRDRIQDWCYVFKRENEQ